MKKFFDRVFSDMFDFEHILTPFAVEHMKRRFVQGTFQTYRIFYVFGIRVAFYATTKFEV